ncbi:hypothetical protein [Longibaculum muris]|uniref:hypothetical protein n=1 Tax=Longibaculum muris TaxID=1796628 RepID=UPI0022E7B379|nr:hypothetical protein [Longibaculum muris]
MKILIAVCIFFIFIANPYFGIFYLFIFIIILAINTQIKLEDEKREKEILKSNIENLPGKDVDFFDKIISDLRIPKRDYLFGANEYGKYKQTPLEFYFDDKNNLCSYSFTDKMCFKLNLRKIQSNLDTNDKLDDLLTILEDHNMFKIELGEVMLALKIKSDTILQIKYIEKDKNEYLDRLRKNYDMYMSLKILEEKLYNKMMTRIQFNLIDSDEFIKLRNKLENEIRIYSNERLLKLNSIDYNPDLEINCAPIMFDEKFYTNQIYSLIIFNGLIFLVNRSNKEVESIHSINKINVEYSDYEEESITHIDFYCTTSKLPEKFKHNQLQNFKPLTRKYCYTYYDHENMDGSCDNRYKDNDFHIREEYTINVCWLTIQFFS